MQIEAKIRDFVARNILFAEVFPHDDHASFLQTGTIDSLGVMELITFAGREYAVQVDPNEVTPENFDSVNKLAAFIRRKQGKSEHNGESNDSATIPLPLSPLSHDSANPLSAVG